MNFKNIKRHFLTICKHKYWVFHYCSLAGIPWQGITHDLSKFSLTEFFESVKYYKGDDSPINACKKDKGYSNAWFHHRGRNPHHYEFWVDNYDNPGKTAILMPYKYALEMLCDYLGAGKAYSGDKFSFQNELLWWCNRRETAVIHPIIKNFISICLTELARAEVLGKNVDKEFKKMNFKEIYYKEIKLYVGNKRVHILY